MVKEFYLTHWWDPIQVLPLHVKVELRVMAMKGYSTFQILGALLSGGLVSYQDTLWGRSYLSTEMQLTYSSTVPCRNEMQNKALHTIVSMVFEPGI